MAGKCTAQLATKEPAEGVRWILSLAVTGILGTFLGYHIGIAQPAALRPIPASLTFRPAVYQQTPASFPATSGTDEQAPVTPVTQEPTAVNSCAQPPTPPVTETTNPHMLPKNIVQKKTDLYFRRLFGEPAEDFVKRPPRYLAAFAVGDNQREMLDQTLRRFSENFSILLFHYDGGGKAADWAGFEWSRRAVHVSAKAQTKWWFAKRFLHPAVVAPYEYVFVWDDDLLPGTSFYADEYVRTAQKYGLEISQPAMGPASHGVTWRLTKLIGNGTDPEVHHWAPADEWCPEGRNAPPCASFVEIMAPVFSRAAWRCVWEMIQNDLVHAWGLDFAMRKCVEAPAESRIGVVDAQWMIHPGIVSLGHPENISGDWTAERSAVRTRCRKEWDIFRGRLNGTRPSGSR